jgi:ATP-dependent Clp protease ATP-binding subunit ClpA
LRGELDAFERLHVARGLAAGRSFGELARVLGISRQAAHRRYRELAPRRRRPPRLKATEHVRQVIRLARAETCAAGRTAVGSRELLLAILRTDTDAARALQAQGITLEAARACPAVDGDGSDPAGLRRILQRAGRLALGRRDRHLTSKHLLLALVADSDCGAARTLAALGATPASLRAALTC